MNTRELPTKKMKFTWIEVKTETIYVIKIVILAWDPGFNWKNLLDHELDF